MYISISIRRTRAGSLMFLTFVEMSSFCYLIVCPIRFSEKSSSLVAPESAKTASVLYH